jgi:hypothetical protein
MVGLQIRSTSNKIYINRPALEGLKVWNRKLILISPTQNLLFTVLALVVTGKSQLNILKNLTLNNENMGIPSKTI